MLTLFFSINMLSAQDCIEKCIEDCYKEERKCFENWNKIRKQCYKACDKLYPPWSDHGYYGDYCKESCDTRYEFNIGYCITDADRCIDACDDLEPGCIEGFTYEESSDKCIYSVPDGYDITVIDNRIYVFRNCDLPGPDCCPAGYQLAIEQACTSTGFRDECRDLIREIETEAALDEAQGDLVDWDDINRQIEEIYADPDCYEEIVDPDCNVCFTEILENVNASTAIIDGQKIILKAICR